MALTLYVRFIDNDEKAKELKLISKGVYEQVRLDSEYVVIKNSNGTELFLDKSSFKCAKKQEYFQFKSHLKNLEKIEKSGLEKVEIKKRWHSKKICINVRNAILLFLPQQEVCIRVLFVVIV